MIQNNVTIAQPDLLVEPFIDKKEAARRMGKSVRYLEGLMRRGVVPFYRIGGYSIAFRWSEVQEHLAKTCRICQPQSSAQSN